MTSNSILAISGSDILSGGGMQSDLAVFHKRRLYPFVALTCVTTFDHQSLQIHPLDQMVFEKELSTLAAVSYRAIKIGLLPTVEMIETVRAFLEQKKTVPTVLDPVLVFKENKDATVKLSQMVSGLLSLFPYATVVTPNLREAEALSGMAIHTMSDMEKAAKILYQYGPKAVVIKGGNRFSKDKAVDLLYDGQSFHTFSAPVLARNNNGAGCTFASVIASYLGECELTEVVVTAKDWVYKAIKQANEYGVVIDDG